MSGTSGRLGRIEDGNTASDFTPEAIERRQSLSLSLLSFEWRGKRVNLIDTPGYPDFIGEPLAGLRAADLAIFVVGAPEGVQVQTELLWKAAEAEGIACAFFVNKVDRDVSGFRRTLDQLSQLLGARIAPFLIPLEGEPGAVDVSTSRAFRYPGGGTQGVVGDLPAAMTGQVADLHRRIVEAVVETDDALLEAYLETGAEPDAEQLVPALHKGLLSGTTYPVLCGSATALFGVDLLADFIVKYGPSPLERPLPPTQADLNGSEATGAYVFKTISDPYVGRISLFRVYAGKIAVDAELENPRAGARGRMHNLFFLHSKDHTPAKELVTGDIAGVAKLEVTATGDTLRTPGSKLVFVPVAMPKPLVSVAVFPKTAHDDEKLSTALGRLVEEDATLNLERRADTHQTLLAGMGDTHLEVSLSRLSRRFGVEVTTAVPKIPYRETVTASADVEGKHKKQSGGRGQFGVASVRFDPLPRSSGYEFVNAIKGGAIPRQLIPAVDRGIQEALARGLLAGFPVVDVRATVYDGKYHSVDSDELSFRMAGIQAVKEAAEDLGLKLLEPVMSVTVRLPEEYLGDLISDINAKRGRIVGTESEGKLRIVSAEIPQAEMQRYGAGLRSITGGRGTSEAVFHHYEELPAHEAQRVITAAAASKEH